LNNAPEWAGRLWIEWTGDIGRSRRLSIAADSTAQSTVFYTPFNDSIQRQARYGLLGARVEYGPSQRRWTVAAYARNLTDTDYITATFGTTLRTSTKILQDDVDFQQARSSSHETPNGAGSNKEADDAGYGVRESH
jgi:outer membrane receptor protein involved in Fe transport